MTLLAAVEETIKTDATSLGAKVEAAARGSLDGGQRQPRVIYPSCSEALRGFAGWKRPRQGFSPALEEAAKTAYKGGFATSRRHNADGG